MFGALTISLGSLLSTQPPSVWKTFSNNQPQLPSRREAPEGFLLCELLLLNVYEIGEIRSRLIFT